MSTCESAGLLVFIAIMEKSDSHFKIQPLRLPGQSIREAIRLRFVRDLASVIVALVLLAFSLGILFGVLISPLGRTTSMLIAIFVMGAAVLVSLRVCRRIDASEVQDKQDLFGEKGERVVADALDVLKRDGFRIFHDVPPEPSNEDGGSLSNYDHIVIGPPGVFVVETKSRHKEDIDAKVVVRADGTVLVSGHLPDRCPIKQVKALRAAIKNMLERQTSMTDVPVRGAVIFPGWFIEDRAYRKAGGDIWTLTPSAFNNWVRSPKERNRLNPDQIALLASRIEDHVRCTSRRAT